MHAPSRAPRVAVFHDTFQYKGGAERLALMAAKALDADLYAAWHHPDSFHPDDFGLKGRFFTLGKPRFNRWLRQLSLRVRSRWRSKAAGKYDALLLSGDCLDVAGNARADALVAYYCHTPPRHLFDQADRYEKKVSPWILPIYRAMAGRLREEWLGYLERADVVIANSLTTAARLREFARRDAVVIHPPVDTSFFCPDASVPKSGHYLSFARLASIKRVDRVVRAFAKLPHLKLVLVHGRNDPQKNEVLELAAGHPNVVCETDVSDERLRQLIRGATANVYVPQHEDFGMNPVESMACGVPVVGVAEGGLLETVVDGKTGVLLKPDFTDADLARALEKMDEKTATSMAAACVERAAEFGLEAFQKNLRTAMRNAPKRRKD